MSWTQVHVSGFTPRTDDNDDDENDDEALETMMNLRYGLETNPEIHWAGPGTSIFKRSNDNKSRKVYAFLSFLSLDSAEHVIQLINSGSSRGIDAGNGSGEQESSLDTDFNLVAELCRKKPKKQPKETTPADLRLKRRRAAPAPKHPVKTSSDKAKLYRR